MVDPHTCDSNPPTRVYVNGTRIPVVETDVYMRTEGNVDYSMYAEVTFASPYSGEDYVNVFGATNTDTQGSYDTVRIEARRFDKNGADTRYYTTFHGMVTGLGNAADGPEQLWALRAQGPAHFLDKIPAEYTANDATVYDILRYVTEKLNERVPININVAEFEPGAARSGETIDDTAESPTDGGSSLALAKSANKLLTTVLGEFNSPKTFHFGEHTLADMLSFFGEKGNFYHWFTPTPDGAGLVNTENPNGRTHEAHALGGDFDVINNDAYSELSPVNTVQLKAKAAKSRDGEDNSAGSKYVEVKAVHEPLYQRAGNTELVATSRLSDAKTKAEAQSEARKILKEHINETTTGTMQGLLNPTTTPYNYVEALPTCNDSEATNVASLTYEITRVHHHANGGDIPQTELNVGVKADADTEITVLDSWEEEI